jgi:pyruvate dehydrogenase E1 component alpha subunit
MPAQTIDGNDLRAVHAAAGEAIAAIRRGAGPHLLECMTFRMAGHFVGDAQHYRSKEELAAIKEKCPIERLKRHLIESGARDSALDAVAEEARREVSDAVAGARAAPRPDPATVLDYVYSAPSLVAISRVNP